jgi:hypothetical protein
LSRVVRDQKKFDYPGVFIYWAVAPFFLRSLLPSPAMAAFERAKKVGKRIVGYPEDQPSVLSSKDWTDNLVKDPKDYVS